MPELPEVETFVRALRRPLVGRTIVGATNDWPRHIVAPLPDELAARIAGRRIEAIDRRGKYLVFTLSDDENLIIHLKMTGHLSVVPADTPRDPYAHTVFDLEARAAQRRIGALQGVGGVHFAGAWCHNGFHEDGLRSAHAVADAIGGAVVVPAPTVDARERVAA